MRNSVLTVLVLGLLLMLIAAPFSALALLMTFLFVAGISWMFWILAKTLIFGDASSGELNKSKDF